MQFSPSVVKFFEQFSGMRNETETVSDLNIFVVDDHPIVCAGLRLSLSDKAKLVGSAAGPDEALERFRTLSPNALILDLVFNGKVRLDFIAKCRALLPKATIVIFSSLPAQDYEETAIAAGADGYVSKEHDLAVLLDVIEDLHRSGPKLSRGRPETFGKPARVLPPAKSRLTKREHEVADMLSRGYSISRISEELKINSKTAAVHCDNIRKKFGCADSRSLIAMLAKAWGVRK